MPLDVHCPSGCRFRLPLSRSGAIVRCPQCKSIIRVPPIDAEKNSPTEQVQVVHAVFSQEGLVAEVTATSPNQPPVTIPPTTPSTDSRPEPTAASVRTLPTPGDQAPLLTVPEPAKAAARRRAPLDVFNPVSESNRAADPKDGGPQIDWHGPPTVPVIDVVEIQIEDEPLRRPGTAIYGVTRFIALCVGMLGLAMLAPILANWLQSDFQVNSGGLSRWQIVQVFLGGLLLAYAVFLYQIFDRAALWSVSVVLLALSCIHAAIAMGTWLDAGAGPMGRWLQIPAPLRAHATLWSFIYTIFGAVLSVLCGYQAFRWQSADHSTLAESRSLEVTSSR